MPNTKDNSIKELRVVFSEILSKELKKYVKSVEDSYDRKYIYKKVLDWLNSIYVSNSGEIEGFTNGTIHPWNLFLFFNKTYSNLLPEINVKSLPLVVNETLSETLKDSTDPLIKRFSKNIAAVKRLYFNKDNSNLLYLSTGSEKIFHLTFNNLFNTIFSKGFLPLANRYIERELANNPEIPKNKIISQFKYDISSVDSFFSTTVPSGIKKLNFRIRYFQKHSEDEHFTLKLEETSFTKAVTRLFDRVSGSQADEFNRKIQTYFETLNKRFDSFVRLKGDFINHYYHVNRYTTESTDNLHKSCMRTSSSPTLYSAFPNQIQMLSLFDSIGKLKGRALLWTAYKLPEPYKSIQNINDYKEIITDKNKVLIIDRVYYDNPKTYNLFAAYCKTKRIKTIYSQSGIDKEDSSKLIIPIDTLTVKELEKLSLKYKLFNSQDSLFKGLSSDFSYEWNRPSIVRSSSALDAHLEVNDTPRDPYIWSSSMIQNKKAKENKVNKDIEKIFLNISWPYLDSFGYAEKIYINGEPTLAFSAKESRVFPNFSKIFTNFYSEKYPNYTNIVSKRNSYEVNVENTLLKICSNSVKEYNILPILINGKKVNLSILTPTEDYSGMENRRQLEIKKLIHSFIVQSKITFSKQISDKLFSFSKDSIKLHLGFAYSFEKNTIVEKTALDISVIFKELVGRDITVREIVLIYGLFLLGGLKFNFLLDYKTTATPSEKYATISDLIYVLFYSNTPAKLIFPDYFIRTNTKETVLAKKEYTISKDTLQKLENRSGVSILNIHTSLFRSMSRVLRYQSAGLIDSSAKFEALNVKIESYIENDEICVDINIYFNVEGQDILLHKDIRKNLRSLILKIQEEYYFPGSFYLKIPSDMSTILNYIFDNYTENVPTVFKSSYASGLRNSMPGESYPLNPVIDHIFSSLNSSLANPGNGNMIKGFEIGMYEKDVDFYNMLIPYISLRNLDIVNHNPKIEVLDTRNEITNILNSLDCLFIEKEKQQTENT